MPVTFFHDRTDLSSETEERSCSLVCSCISDTALPLTKETKRLKEQQVFTIRTVIYSVVRQFNFPFILRAVERNVESRTR